MADIIGLQSYEFSAKYPKDFAIFFAPPAWIFGQGKNVDNFFAFFAKKLDWAAIFFVTLRPNSEQMPAHHTNKKRKKKRRLKPRWGRIFLAFIILAGLLWLACRGIARCASGHGKTHNDELETLNGDSLNGELTMQNGELSASTAPDAPITPTVPASLRELLSAGDNPWDKHLDAMPDDGCIKLKINPIGGSLAKVFDDVNSLHLEAARQLGIDTISTDAQAWRLKRPIVEIRSCPEYYVDDLKHSYPFLVPEAARLLSDIGAAFNAELAARGGGAYRVKVTSVTRTPLTVGRLRRVNRNATSESAHQYGTTFDISYGKFICDDDTQPRRTQEDLKNLLAETLQQLRSADRCYVKYEHKQACFHITVRQ